MIKTTELIVSVTPVNSEHFHVGPTGTALMYTMYHVDESPGTSTTTLSMVDSGLTLEIYPDSSVVFLHLISVKTGMDVYYPVSERVDYGPSGGYFTTVTPMVIIPDEHDV